jgi:amino-acid N-acetyltransferase
VEQPVSVRSAILPDAAAISRLIDAYVPDGTLLARSLAEINENIRDFVVAEHEGEVVGCGALHLYGLHLAEIRSIAVHAEFHRRGVGRALVKALLGEAQRQRVTCVCLFTRIPEFFAGAGFTVASHRALPDKILKDCLRCPRRHACDEVAMIRGELPAVEIATLPAPGRHHLAGMP